MTREEIAKRTKEVIFFALANSNHSLDVKFEEVKDEAHLEYDLGADSLDRVDIVLQLEDAFDLRIESDDADNLCTVKEHIDLIEKMLSGIKETSKIPDDKVGLIGRFRSKMFN